MRWAVGKSHIYNAMAFLNIKWMPGCYEKVDQPQNRGDLTARLKVNASPINNTTILY